MNDCKKVHEIWDAGTAGSDPGSVDLEFVKTHLETCQECMLEHAALESLGPDTPCGPPAFTENDLARRRWIDETLDIVDGEEKKALAPSRSSRRWSWMGAAAAVLLLGAAAIVFAVHDWTEEGEGIPARLSGENGLLEGAVVLRSGVEPAAFGRVGTISTLAEGDSFLANEGAAMVAVSEDVLVHLSPGTTLAFEQMNEAQLDIAVESGRAVFSVDPQTSIKRIRAHFSGGYAQVTGTVFFVEAAGRVGVERGSVEVHAGEFTKRIGVGEVASIEGQDPVVDPIGEDTRAEISAIMATMDLISSEDSGVFTVRSLPSGAKVLVDGREIGITPLAAHIRQGHREVRLELAGHTPVRELVDMGRRSIINRVFALDAYAVDSAPSSAAVATVDEVKDENPLEAKKERESGSDTTPAQLLAQAQASRASKDWSDAAGHYKTLIARFPQSVEARAARVSLGEILLGRLSDPRGAQIAFQSYLTVLPKGSLAPEALWGKCRALKRQGQEELEKGALDELISAYPGAIQAAAARQRLELLRGTETE